MKRSRKDYEEIRVKVSTRRILYFGGKRENVSYF
jgi:hypothetical protein